MIMYLYVTLTGNNNLFSNKVNVGDLFSNAMNQEQGNTKY
jgi:hypothetical protein